MSIKNQDTKRKTISTPCDIYESNGKIHLRMDMPGVNKEDLDIRIDRDQLAIYGKRKTLNYDKGNFIVREIVDGDIYRSFTIDETIDRNKIDASIENGVLVLSLNLKESEKPRKIEVTSKQ